jgi:hypothetical protein
MASVVAICGPDCLVKRLHISLLQDPAPTLRYSALVDRLAAEEALGLAAALQQQEPIGIMGTIDDIDVADTYVPTSEMLFGVAVYVGLDSRYYMVACDPQLVDARLAVITRSADRMQWALCNGSVWIDLQTAKASRRLRDGATAIGLNFLTGLGECSSVIRTLPNALVDGRLTFAAGTPPEHVSCWLCRFFGPQVSRKTLERPGVVVLPAGLVASVRLLADFVVHAGSAVVIEGSRITIAMGSSQFRVSQGAELYLNQITITESQSTAFLVDAGRIVAREATFRRCRVSANMVNLLGNVVAAGGVFFLRNGTLDLQDSDVSDNGAIATRERQEAHGGAIYAVESQLRLVNCTLLQNTATSLYVSRGGAVYIAKNSFAVFIGSVVSESAASIPATELSANQDNKGEGGGLFVELSTLGLQAVTINRNRATMGAGMHVVTSSLNIAESSLAENVAASIGGAPLPLAVLAATHACGNRCLLFGWRQHR